MANEEERKKAKTSSIDDKEEGEEGLKIDLSDVDKKPAKIGKVEVIETTSDWTYGTGQDQSKLQKGLKRPVEKIRIESEVVKEVEIEKDGKKTIIKIKASELFGMAEPEEGKFLIPVGEKANLNKFLKGLKLPTGKGATKESLKNLIGKEVVTKVRDNNFLGFYKE